MKKLLIGLLILGSFSTFAKDIFLVVTPNSGFYGASGWPEAFQNTGYSVIYHGEVGSWWYDIYNDNNISDDTLIAFRSFPEVRSPKCKVKMIIAEKKDLKRIISDRDETSILYAKTSKLRRCPKAGMEVLLDIPYPENL